jgi:hypothetical protein
MGNGIIPAIEVLLHNSMMYSELEGTRIMRGNVEWKIIMRPSYGVLRMWKLSMNKKGV